MKNFFSIVGLLLLFFLALFFLVEALHISVLVDPSDLLVHPTIVTALFGVSLLIADIFLPIPSSLVMTAHGALFGVIPGAILSLIGIVGATLVGFGVGRRGGALMQRYVTAAEQERINGFLSLWGALGIVITRPIPLLAETVSIVAGTSKLSWQEVFLSALAGGLAPALLYALMGALAKSFTNSALMFLFILILSFIFWLVLKKSRLIEKKTLVR